jgi:hypothetical protein
MTVIAEWDGLEIDPALLSALGGYGYNVSVTYGGQDQPRFLAYMRAGIAEVAASAVTATTGAATATTQAGIATAQATASTNAAASASSSEAVVLAATANTNSIWCGAATGTAAAITLTPSPAPSAYTAGQTIRFIATFAATGATTVSVSGSGVKNLKDAAGSEIALNAWVSGEVVSATYNGTEFRRSGGGSGGASASTLWAAACALMGA